MKVYLSSTFLVILLRLSATAPEVSVKVRGKNGVVEQGQTAYIDINLVDPQSFESTIQCTWSALDNVTMFEIIRWENQSERSRNILYSGTTHNLFQNHVTYSMNAATYRSGGYGCDIRNGNEVTSSDGVVYLSRPPKVTIEQQEDVHLGGTAVFSCEIKDDFDTFTADVTRAVVFRYVIGNDTTPRDLSSVPGGSKWQEDGTTLRIINVQEWAMNVRVACLVTSPKSAVKSQGDYYWSPYVPITVLDPPPPPPPASAYVATIAIGSTGLLALLLVVPIVLFVVVFKKKGRIDPGPRAPSSATDAEQGPGDCYTASYPCLGQDMEPSHGVGVGYTAPHVPHYDPAALVTFPLPGTCVPEPPSPIMGRFQ